MPRYFFNLCKQVSVSDDYGMEFPDLAAAEAYALEDARDLAAEQVRRGKLILSHKIEITDDQAQVLRTIRLADAIEIADLPPTEANR